MKKVLFANHKERQCGVHEYGVNVYNNIKNSTKYNILYAEASDHGEFVRELEKYPDLSVIIYNYYPSTMPWANNSVIKERRKFVKQLIIKHETDTPVADGYIHIDPSFQEHDSHFKTSRPLLKYSGIYPINDVVHIGSFGFGFGNKGFPDIVTKVNAEFDSAVIQINIPYAKFGDETGRSARSIATICNAIPRKESVKLQINHTFLETPQLLEFLASNDINVFFYDLSYGRGISSVIDYALSVKRPIALTKSYQFKHMTTAPIFVEEKSIKDILQAGTVPLEPYYDAWSEINIIKDYERIIDKTLE